MDIKDLEYMREAMELSLKGEGGVDPNPLVGAIVVKDGKIVGRGYHRYYGGPHAEVYALEEAGKDALGGTIYVTLEPCSHYGKTPPCAKLIVEKGIKRCVVALEDPNPLVGGNGIKYLRENGVEVEVGLLEDDGRDINRVFLHNFHEKRAFGFLKCGITLDGKIATRSGSSKWITNAIARERVQRLRSKYSGIIVGIGTVLKDNPSLTARVEGGRNPFRIVIDPKLEIPEESKIIGSDGKTIIVTSSENKLLEKTENLKEKVNFIYIDGYEFKMVEVFERLREEKVNSVIIEGGRDLISRAFKEDVVDGGEIFIAPKIIGDSKGISFVDGFVVDEISSAMELPNVTHNIYGNNISFEFYKKRKEG